MKVCRDKYLPLLTDFTTSDALVLQLQENHRELIQKVAELAQPTFCLLITGSDGRGEKMKTTSPIEAILVIKEKDIDLIDRIKNIIKTDSRFLSDIDIKVLDDQEERLISFNREPDIEKPKKFQPFPTRALDAAFLTGSQYFYRKYKHRFFKELKSQDKSIRSTLRHFRTSALKESVRLLKDNLAGKGNDFNPATGIFFFDNGRIKGPKYPMLRTMQYAIGDHICKLVALNLIDEDEFRELPSSVAGRLTWLGNHNFLKIENRELQKVKKAYAVALIWSAEGQENLKNSGRDVIELAVSPQQMNKTGKRILAFAQSTAQTNLQKLSNVK